MIIISSISHNISYLFQFLKLIYTFNDYGCGMYTFQVKLLNVHIQWLLAIECVDSMAKPLNVHIQ